MLPHRPLSSNRVTIVAVLCIAAAIGPALFIVGKASADQILTDRQFNSIKTWLRYFNISGKQADALRAQYNSTVYKADRANSAVNDVIVFLDKTGIDVPPGEHPTMKELKDKYVVTTP